MVAVRTILRYPSWEMACSMRIVHIRSRTCLHIRGKTLRHCSPPRGFAEKMYEENNAVRYIAAWDNLDDYEDEDRFNVTVYDLNGDYVANNIWPKRIIVQRGYGGIPIQAEYLVVGDGQDYGYRFTVQAYSSRPNEYGPSLMPDPVPEEYYSPWLYKEQ